MQIDFRFKNAKIYNIVDAQKIEGVSLEKVPEACVIDTLALDFNKEVTILESLFDTHCFNSRTIVSVNEFVIASNDVVSE